MDRSIYTPRVCIDMLKHLFFAGAVSNPMVCTKIPYKGYEISISMDSSHGPGDLQRTDIRIYSINETNIELDVTEQFLQAGENMIYGYGEDLHRVFKMIDEISK